jgi:hypothetical protein
MKLRDIILFNLALSPLVIIWTWAFIALIGEL